MEGTLLTRAAASEHVIRDKRLSIGLALPMLSVCQTALGLTVATSNGAADRIWFEYTGPNDLIQP